MVAAALRGHASVLQALIKFAPYETIEETREALTKALLAVPISGHVSMARLLIKMRAHVIRRRLCKL